MSESALWSADIFDVSAQTYILDIAQPVTRAERRRVARDRHTDSAGVAAVAAHLIKKGNIPLQVVYVSHVGEHLPNGVAVRPRGGVGMDAARVWRLILEGVCDE